MSDYYLELVLPYFLSYGISIANFWELTPREIYNTMQVQRELAERRYHEQSGMAYISAIMNAEAHHGKLKSFEHYFPSAKKATSADVDKAQRIKLNMLKFAHAHNAQSKYKQKGDGRY